MKKVFFVMVLAIVSLIYVQTAYSLDLKALQEELHKRGDPWIAGTTSVSELSLEEKKVLCGLIISPPGEIPERGIEKIKHIKNLPTKWDWRDVDGKNWMTRAKNQGNCGSCWSFTVIGAFEARINIANGEPNYDFDLSEQFQVSCDGNNGGCGGGVLEYAVYFLRYTGVPDEACFPYQASDLPCTDRCGDWASRVIKSSDYGYTYTASEYRDLIYEGPVGGSFDMKEDFLYYKSGVYDPVMGENFKAGHGMCLCGWDDPGNCWLVKNSWGEGWGTQGFGWISMTTYYPHTVGWNSVPPATVPAISLEYEEVNEPNDGTWDPGEAVDIITTLKNAGMNATNVQGVLSTSDSYITIGDGSASFGLVPNGGTADNAGDPFGVTASSSTPMPHAIQFNLHVTADGGYSKDIQFEVQMGAGGVINCFDSPIDYVYGIGFDGTYLWATDFASSSIMKLDQSGNQVGTITAPYDSMCTGIDYDATNDVLWVHNFDTKKIYKVNPSNGAVLDDFSSPATQYPTGLAFDGTHLWVVDRDQYKIYKLDTSGNQLSNFAIPVSPQVQYGPRGLAFEPEGIDGGTLLLVMSYFTETSPDSTVVYEITRTGSLVSGHHFKTPHATGRAIEVNSTVNEYWVAEWAGKQICRIRGFFTAEVEEPSLSTGISSLTISPNPSRHGASVSFYLPRDSKITLNIYDIMGKRVYCLADRVFKSGNHRINWDGKDESDRRIPCGIYFYRLETPEFTATEKLIILK